MAGFLIAIISGALMSLQGAFNTNVTKASSVWVTAMFVQLTALATCAIMWVIDGRPDIMKLFKVEQDNTSWWRDRCIYNIYSYKKYKWSWNC